MKILYERSFLRDIKRIDDRNIQQKILDVIEHIKSTENLHTISNIKKLKGHPSSYRIRIGDFRIGLFYENEIIIFVRFMHRKDIYNKFP